MAASVASANTTGARLILDVEFPLLPAPNPVNSFRAVIFDLDGTLVDSSAEIATALARTFEDLGLAPLPRREVETLIGRGVRSLVERSLAQAGAPGADLDASVERFEAHYAQTVGTAAELFPGVLAGMRRLREAGLAMGVVTNKPRFFTQQLLERLGVAEMLAAVVAGDDGIPRKPHGDMLRAACERMGSRPEDTLMVGDSDNDVLAARAAGCPVWCVPYGYNEGRGAGTLACDRLVDTIEQAAGLLVRPAR
jgi:phosphoglycolate phosphatase